ncbi:MAG TPA: GNAT family N-acetyltransferase [Candidatus Hydrogenedentes bacterium]|nr:GNAT family N-acetyltransferase [Candidatus Hydrogenedentota bacterium]HPG69369.1 GNAT family N-acetyltransferase [Candidatus Hydrogenedentota bacterium]
MSQLRMEKVNLDDVPEIPIPEGYTLRAFEPGEEAALGRVYAASNLGTETAEAVQRNILGHPCYVPGRVLVVEHGGELVGTAAAWVKAEAPEAGYLHMVGLLPEHRGKRLGAILTVAAIRYSRREGFARHILDTDDWREPAIRLYVGLGYDAVYTDETHPGRWQALAEKLGCPEILARARDARSTSA